VGFIAATPLVGVLVAGLCALDGASETATVLAGWWSAILLAFALAIIDTAQTPKPLRNWGWLWIILFALLIAPVYLAERARRMRTSRWPWIVSLGLLVVGFVAIYSIGGLAESSSDPGGGASSGQAKDAPSSSPADCSDISDDVAVILNFGGKTLTQSRYKKLAAAVNDMETFSEITNDASAAYATQNFLNIMPGNIEFGDQFVIPDTPSNRAVVKQFRTVCGFK
jgi:hypothetical protein